MNDSTPTMKVRVVPQARVLLPNKGRFEDNRCPLQTCSTRFYRVGVDSALKPRKWAAMQRFLFLRSCCKDT